MSACYRESPEREQRREKVLKTPTFFRSEAPIYIGIIAATIGFIVCMFVCIGAVAENECNERREHYLQRIEECRSSGRIWHETEIGNCGADVIEGECWDR